MIGGDSRSRNRGGRHDHPVRQDTVGYADMLKSPPSVGFSSESRLEIIRQTLCQWLSRNGSKAIKAMSLYGGSNGQEKELPVRGIAGFGSGGRKAAGRDIGAAEPYTDVRAESQAES